MRIYLTLKHRFGKSSLRRSLTTACLSAQGTKPTDLAVRSNLIRGGSVILGWFVSTRNIVMLPMNASEAAKKAPKHWSLFGIAR